MSVTINGNTFANLRQVPLKYDSTNTIAGLTAKRWEYTGLLLPSEFTTLTGIYESWRNAKILEEDPAISLVQGTTVSVTVAGTGGATNVACWFDLPPEGQALGKFIEVTIGVVDAAEKIELLASLEQEADTNEEDLAALLGTYTYGGVVINLTQPTPTFRQNFDATFALSGQHYISGTFLVEDIINVIGYFDSDDYPAGVASINAQHKTDASGAVINGDLVPLKPPTFTPAVIKKGGVNVIRYSVSIQLLEII